MKSMRPRNRCKKMRIYLQEAPLVKQRSPKLLKSLWAMKGITTLVNGLTRSIRSFWKVCNSLERIGTLSKIILGRDPAPRQGLTLKNSLGNWWSKAYLREGLDHKESKRKGGSLIALKKSGINLHRESEADLTACAKTESKSSSKIVVTTCTS